jgi:hypothetical protein
MFTSAYTRACNCMVACPPRESLALQQAERMAPHTCLQKCKHVAAFGCYLVLHRQDSLICQQTMCGGPSHFTRKDALRQHKVTKNNWTIQMASIYVCNIQTCFAVVSLTPRTRAHTSSRAGYKGTSLESRRAPAACSLDTYK